jgi:hypothetical protein
MEDIAVMGQTCARSAACCHATYLSGQAKTALARWPTGRRPLNWEDAFQTEVSTRIWRSVSVRY